MAGGWSILCVGQYTGVSAGAGQTLVWEFAAHAVGEGVDVLIGEIEARRGGMSGAVGIAAFDAERSSAHLGACPSNRKSPSPAKQNSHWGKLR
jgi:hypothetical protein